jgi:hypothetical protein
VNVETIGEDEPILRTTPYDTANYCQIAGICWESGASPSASIVAGPALEGDIEADIDVDEVIPVVES